MQKDIKNLLKVKIIWLAIAITIGIAYLSLIKTANFPDVDILNADKLYHTIAYFALTIFWLMSLKRIKYKYIVVGSCIIYGIIIELMQFGLTTYRTGDFYDFLANTLGASLALLIFNLYNKKK